MGTQININAEAMKRCSKRLKISIGVCLVITCICLPIFIFSLVIAFEEPGLWYEAMLFLLLTGMWAFVAKVQIGKLRRLKPLLHAAEDGEVSVPGIAKRCRLGENDVEKHLKYMIKKGIFPGAVVERDMLVPMGGLQSKAMPAGRVNLNTASEEELAKLPGVGILRANNAVALRMQNGFFSSVSDFCQRLGLMPHHAAQLEDLAFAVPPPPDESSFVNKGRVIDL